MKTALIKLIASGLYSGYGRPFPGTWGTVPAWLLAYFVIRGDQVILGVTTVACMIVSVWAAGAAEKVYGHDARTIVIDEWAGMFVTLVAIPFSLASYLLAFLVFRGFDVFKFWPAGASEQLPGGWGVTADDVVAGVQGNIALQLLLLVLTRLGWV